MALNAFCTRQMDAQVPASVEVKSGYGLSLEDELNMLRAARIQGQRTARSSYMHVKSPQWPQPLRAFLRGSRAYPDDRCTKSQLVCLSSNMARISAITASATGVGEK
jgi:hypothetical protein